MFFRVLLDKGERSGREKGGLKVWFDFFFQQSESVSDRLTINVDGYIDDVFDKIRESICLKVIAARVFLRENSFFSRLFPSTF